MLRQFKEWIDILSGGYRARLIPSGLTDNRNILLQDRSGIIALLQPRVVPLVDAATVTPNCDITDIGNLNSLSQSTFFANPTGTPFDGQSLLLRVTSTTSRSISFDSAYGPTANLPLPTATTGGGSTDFYGLRYNSSLLLWQLVASSQPV